MPSFASLQPDPSCCLARLQIYVIMQQSVGESFEMPRAAKHALISIHPGQKSCLALLRLSSVRDLADSYRTAVDTAKVAML